MSKLIADIPLSSIAAIELRVSRCRETLSQVVAYAMAKRPGCKVYVLNGGMWNRDGSPCPLLKADGVTLSKTPWTAYGYGWDVGPDIHLTANLTDRNFIATTPLIGPYGAISKLSYDKAQGGIRGRTAVAMVGDKLRLYCTQDGTGDARTPEALRDELTVAGCKSAIMLDSGGSSMCDFDGKRLPGDGRRCHNYLIVYVREDPEKEDKPVKKIVCLDPGHGPGCSNGSPDGSYKEYEFAWDMSQRVKSHLERCGVTVLMTKSKDGYPSLKTRCDISNKANTDLFVSLHSNASGNGWTAPHGLVIYTSVAGATAGRNIAANKVLARMRAAGVATLGGGLQHNPTYAVLRGTKAPAMIMEYGFHTNKGDVELLKDGAHRDKLALATAQGVCDYLGVKWVDGSKPDYRAVTQKRFGFAESTMHHLEAYEYADALFERLATGK